MTAPNERRPRRPRAVPVRALELSAALLALAASPLPSRAETETEVRVERVRPHVDKHVTLRFLRENRDFLRAALDRTREKTVTRDAEAASVDPRFLAYRELMAQVMAAHDSVALAEEARQRRDLLRSVTQLGELETQLDLLDRQLAEQRVRLGVLQRDFTGDQRTALAVVLIGYPQDVVLSQVALNLDDGSTLTVPLSADQRDALRKGGAVQIFHGFVEPREQVVQVALAGERGPAGDAGYVTLEPPRDRLTLLRLDLSAVHAREGATAIHASTWLNDARNP